MTVGLGRSQGRKHSRSPPHHLVLLVRPSPLTPIAAKRQVSHPSPTPLHTNTYPHTHIHTATTTTRALSLPLTRSIPTLYTLGWWVLQFKILKRDPKTERSQQQTEQQRKAAQQSQLSNKTVRLRFATVPTPATFEPRSHSSMSCIFELTYKVAVVPAPPPLPNVAHNTTLWGSGFIGGTLASQLAEKQAEYATARARIMGSTDAQDVAAARYRIPESHLSHCSMCHAHAPPIPPRARALPLSPAMPSSGLVGTLSLGSFKRAIGVCNRLLPFRSHLTAPTNLSHKTPFCDLNLSRPLSRHPSVTLTSLACYPHISLAATRNGRSRRRTTRTTRSSVHPGDRTAPRALPAVEPPTTPQ